MKMYIPINIQIALLFCFVVGMVNIAKIFKKKAIPSEPRISTMPSVLSEMTRLPNEKLSDILFPVGSKRLVKITKLVMKKEEQLEHERKAQEATLKPILEQRKKIHNAIEEIIARIRKLPAETLTSEGISQAKILYGLLGEMEKNDQEFRRLNPNSNMTYSYKTNDLPLENINATLHFIGLIRSNRIFRPAKGEK